MDYQLVVEGSAVDASKVRSIVAHDAMDDVADTLDVCFVANNPIKRPRIDSEARLYLGGSEYARYRIGRIEVSAKALRLFGTGYNKAGALKESREKDYESKKLKDVIEQVAKEFEKKPLITSKINVLESDRNYIQKNVSTIRFLHDIMSEKDGYIKLYGDYLIAGTCTEPGYLGEKPMQALEFGPDMVFGDYTHTEEKRDKYQGVKAQYVGSSYVQEECSAGESPFKLLPGCFSSCEEAQAACTAAAKELGDVGVTLRMTTNLRGDLRAGKPLNVKGLHPAVDGKYIVQKATHYIANKTKTEITARGVS